MDKKIIIPSIIGGLIVASILMVLITSTFNRIWPIQMPLVSPQKEPSEVKLKMGVGYSIKKDSVEAVNEAYNRMKEQLNGEIPNFVILYSSVGYDQEKVLSQANTLMPQAKIYGYTSIVGTMTNEGFHVGEGVNEGYSLSLMGFSSSYLTAGVGAANLNEASSAREIAKLAANRAIENVGENSQTKPKVVFITSAPFGQGIEEEVVAGVEDVLGKDIPIVGGIASGDEAYTGGWRMFANSSVLEKGVVVAPIYTDVKVGYIYLSGFNPTEKKGIVTKFAKTKERILYEIDGKPAGEVLNDWLDGLLKDHLGTSDVIIPIMGVHPLGEKIIERGGYVNWALIYPWWFHPDNSLTVGVGAPEGTELYLLEGDPELLIKRPAITARLARVRGEITQAEIAGVVMDHCGGTMRAIPRARVGEIVPAINQAIVNAPFIGTFDSGNYGYFSGVGNRYGNMMVSMVVFGKN